MEMRAGGQLWSVGPWPKEEQAEEENVEKSRQQGDSPRGALFQGSGWSPYLRL